MSKHSIDLKLILPHDLEMDDFVEMINGALKNSSYVRDKYHWDHENNKEMILSHSVNGYKLEPIFGNGLLLEFSKDEQKNKN